MKTDREKFNSILGIMSEIFNGKIIQYDTYLTASFLMQAINLASMHVHTKAHRIYNISNN